MADPLSLVPYAVAAAGGAIDGIPASKLVAAGLTLLQRSPEVVRALSGKRSAILLPTCAQYLTALAASDGRGAVLINPLASPLEILHQISDANVGAIFTSAALESHVPAEIPRVILDDAPRRAIVKAGDIVRTVDLGAHFGLELEGDTRAEGADEEAVIVYTSAMVGRPLGAILTHRNLLSNARATVAAVENTADDLSLAILPFSHLFGLVVSGIAPLLAGGRVMTMDRFNPIRAIDLIEREGVTELVAVPAVFAALISAMERRGVPMKQSKLRMSICGGAVLRPEIQSRWAEVTGAELRQGYGLTEAGPVCLFNRASRPNVRGALGVPFPGVEVEIRDSQSRVRCAEGTEGEIVVRGPNVSPGYVAAGGAGLAVVDGWLRTGDIGAQLPDGSIEFRGLLKAMFTRNGFNIYPMELESAVMELSGLSRARVTPLPSEGRENDIRLEVTGNRTIEEIRDWCIKRLSAYKQPTEIAVV